MRLRDRIVMTLWVERQAGPFRVADLAGTSRDEAYAEMFHLVSAGLLSHPVVGVYRLTAAGHDRARAILFGRMTLFGPTLVDRAAVAEVFHG